MDKELCLKFLVHLHKCSHTVLQKQHIDAMDITYINNEVDIFHRKLDPTLTSLYDRAGALTKVARIKEEDAADKAKFITKMILKSQFKWLGLIFGTRDDAHAQREAKVLEFKETVRKVLALVEYAS